jgi:hypothetical protein
MVRGMLSKVVFNCCQKSAVAAARLCLAHFEHGRALTSMCSTAQPPYNRLEFGGFMHGLANVACLNMISERAWAVQRQLWQP